MPRIDTDVFERVGIIARKSTMLHRHGAIVMHNGEIVAEGYNRIAHHLEHAYSIHAEVDALNKIKNKGRRFWEECTLIVVRIGSDKQAMHYKESKPCESCQRAIRNFGIRRVFYSVNGA